MGLINMSQNFYSSAGMIGPILGEPPRWYSFKKWILKMLKTLIKKLRCWLGFHATPRDWFDTYSIGRCRWCGEKNVKNNI